MKNLIILMSLFSIFGCGKFSTIEPYTSNNIALKIQTSKVSTFGQLPFTEGCTIEIIQNPTDGGLVVSQQTGEFNYIFQDLSISTHNQDKFSFRQNCPQGSSPELWVIIDTSEIFY